MNHTRKVVISSAKNFLAHTPGLVRYGSKPIREIDNNPNTLQTIKEHSRGFTDAVSYPPNQVYIGGISVDNLAKTKLLELQTYKSSIILTAHMFEEQDEIST